MNMKVNIIIGEFFMAKRYKKHSSAFKAKIALDAIREQKTLNELRQEHSIAPAQISIWKRHAEENMRSLFEGKQEKDQQEEIDRLHRVIGQITADRDFLDRSLNR